jgi:hypothetical protein
MTKSRGRRRTRPLEMRRGKRRVDDEMGVVEREEGEEEVSEGVREDEVEQ